MIKLATLSALAAIVPLLVSAQAPVWGQCGGAGWNGATTCVSDSVCTVVSQWYSQCTPDASTVPTSTTPVPTQAPDTNPYTGHDVWLTPFYASEVSAAAAVMTNAAQAANALKVAKIPTFTWFDTVAKVPMLDGYLASAREQQKKSGKKVLVQIVVYDLPDRDCSAKASHGEFEIAKDGVTKYKNYVDQLAAIIKKYPDLRIVAIIEPDSLANMATNMSFPKCANAAAAYKECTIYTVKALNKLGVYMYLDGGHTGWLGWPDNIEPAAKIMAEIYNEAGKPKFLRGMATNVSNFNALRASSPDPATVPNPNYDESRFIDAFAPALAASGFPAKFIVDQGRSGVQNIRPSWSNWCNLKGAGFGMRPTSNTGSPHIDQIVWVKPGGECDGTSDTTKERYDENCGLETAMKGAPEAGQWFQAYFEMLVKNATPAL
ncbi:cellobiohydrolaseII [Pterulicium gracile]|uniref:Glucanase n=1 Tax=Pterulicium gracile TaxID=1884261 RepID=A0A5C3QFS9_9AGAR|nr:cellobiohydrolaseII [Pterula gracilis]